MKKKKKSKDKIRYKNKMIKKELAKTAETENIINAAAEKMEKRLSEMTGAEHKIIRNASLVSMSDCLLEFAEPAIDALDKYDDKKEYEKAIIMAIALWNSAIMQDEGKEDAAKKILDTLIFDEESKNLVEYMLNRKRQMFPDNNRYILDYELTVKRRGNYHLTVVSTLNPDNHDEFEKT